MRRAGFFSAASIACASQSEGADDVKCHARPDNCHHLSSLGAAKLLEPSQTGVRRGGVNTIGGRV
jgi:hypothetical protein